MVDSAPVILLSSLGQFHLLHERFAEILLAPSVEREDGALRRLCREEQLPVSGTVGVLVRARLDGKIHALKPQLDQLIAAGFRLDPRGDVYREALARVSE